MLELIVVRHGQSVADVEDRYEGQADFPLSTLGLEQADKLASWIHSNYPCEHIISSPLKRAALTAQIIGAELKANILFNDDLKELSKGLIDGLLKAEADERYPKPIGGHSYNAPIHHGESLQSFATRVQRFWLHQIVPLADMGEGRRLLIVTHGGVINMLYACLMNLAPSADLSLHTAHTGVHCWRIDNKNKSILFANLTEHLI